jgi:hypothetical protein
MDNTVLKIIFDFLETKENRNPPFLWKWKNGIPLIEEDLEVGGDLDLRDSKITSLPEGLKVGGDLDLTYVNIKSLPKRLKVGGDLFIRASVFAMDLDDDELREMVKPGFIKGRIVR